MLRLINVPCYVRLEPGGHRWWQGRTASLPRGAASLLLTVCLVTLGGCQRRDDQSTQLAQIEQARLDEERSQREKTQQLAQIEQTRLEEERSQREKEQQQKIEYKNAIESALREDANTSHVSNFADRAEVMRGIDVSKCPPEYRAAYIDHIYAWQYAAKVQAAWNQLESDRNVAGTIIAALIDQAVDGSGKADIQNLADQEEQLKRLRAVASQQISDTFQKVERIAALYGASLPQQQ